MPATPSSPGAMNCSAIVDDVAFVGCSAATAAGGVESFSTRATSCTRSGDPGISANRDAPEAGVSRVIVASGEFSVPVAPVGSP